MPLVSVIIPSYQSADALPNALDSVQRQTFTDLEVIVVDDGSTDDTRAVVEAASTADPRIRYLYQENQGPAAARNTGIAAAEGEYIALLDADDTWEPEKLAGQVAILERHPEIGIVITDSVNINTVDGQRFRFSEHYASALQQLTLTPLEVEGLTDVYRLEGNFRHILFSRNFIHTSSVVMRKAVVEEVGGFNPACFGTEDIVLWLRLIRVTRFGYWRHVCTTRTKTESSLSFFSEQRLLAVKALYDMYLASPEDTDLHPMIHRKMRKLHRQMARLYGRSGAPRRAIRVFVDSLPFGFDARTAAFAAASLLGPLPFAVGRRLSQLANTLRTG